MHHIKPDDVLEVLRRRVEDTAAQATFALDVAVMEKRVFLKFVEALDDKEASYIAKLCPCLEAAVRMMAERGTAHSLWLRQQQRKHKRSLRRTLSTSESSQVSARSEAEPASQSPNPGLHASCPPSVRSAQDPPARRSSSQRTRKPETLDLVLTARKRILHDDYPHAAAADILQVQAFRINVKISVRVPRGYTQVLSALCSVARQEYGVERNVFERQDEGRHTPEPESRESSGDDEAWERAREILWTTGQSLGETGAGESADGLESGVENSETLLEGGGNTEGGVLDDETRSSVDGHVDINLLPQDSSTTGAESHVPSESERSSTETSPLLETFASASLLTDPAPDGDSSSPSGLSREPEPEPEITISDVIVDAVQARRWGHVFSRNSARTAVRVLRALQEENNTRPISFELSTAGSNEEEVERERTSVSQSDAEDENGDDGYEDGNANENEDEDGDEDRDEVMVFTPNVRRSVEFDGVEMRVEVCVDPETGEAGEIRYPSLEPQREREGDAS